MPYGAQLINAFGEDVTRRGKSLAVKHIGDSLRDTPERRYYIGANFVSKSWAYTDYPRWEAGVAANQVDNVIGMWRWAAHGSNTVSWSKTFQSRNDYLCDTYALNRRDLVFWEVPAVGIVHAINFWIDPPDVALAGRKICAIVPGSKAYTGLPKYVVATDDADVDLSQSYGMQIFDENAQTIYDSRGNNVVVRDFRVFSQAEVTDVLTNDASYTFTPRAAPVGGPMVSLTNSMSGYKPGPNWIYWPNLTWDGTSFTLSRISKKVSDSSIRFSVFQGFGITVADAEW